MSNTSVYLIAQSNNLYKEIHLEMFKLQLGIFFVLLFQVGMAANILSDSNVW